MDVSPTVRLPEPGPRFARVRRILGILFGIGTQIGFAVTVRHLFLFLRDGRSTITWEAPAVHPLLLNGLLALQFAVIHSVLLHPRVQRRLTRWIPRPLYGCMFCVVTCLTLLLAIACWTPSTFAVYDLRGTVAEPVIQAGFYGSWIALFYSLHLSGLGYQTGWTPWWYWFRRQPQPKRRFAERGAYRLFRHPIYLSFLGLIWFTPLMTLDHAVLTGVWSVYIFVGSYLKDERLAFYLGAQYRDYQRRVPGYPGLRHGPLGRRSAEPDRGRDEPPAEGDAAPTRKAA